MYNKTETQHVSHLRAVVSQVSNFGDTSLRGEPTKMEQTQTAAEAELDLHVTFFNKEAEKGWWSSDTTVTENPVFGVLMHFPIHTIYIYNMTHIWKHISVIINVHIFLIFYGLFLCSSKSKMRDLHFTVVFSKDPRGLHPICSLSFGFRQQFAALRDGRSCCTAHVGSEWEESLLTSPS